MTGVLAGLRVLDFSSGIAGPIATMLLADHGAEVTRIEPPGGHPLDAASGAPVWLRGKRRATLDLRDPDDRATAVALAAHADVVVETFAPGTAARLGLDHEVLRAENERLVHCTVTGYGEQPRVERPGIDALVAARTGHQFEIRGVAGGTIGRLSGAPILPQLEPRDDLFVGPSRPGPLFSAVPWPSLAAAYLATLGISAALRARAVTGVGQHVHTSLLQGVLASTVMTWSRAQRADAPGFQSWIADPRAPKGFFRAADGAWTHHWVPLPGFILGAAAGDELAPAAELDGPRTASVRIATMPEDMVLLHSYDSQLRDAVSRFPSDAWVQLAAEVGVPVQRVRPPEEALRDPAFRADGAVAALHDADVGPILAVGQAYELSACPDAPLGPIARAGEHTAATRTEAALNGRVARVKPTGATLRHPLDGVVVLDLGLAIAGPFGTQLLSDLGATVIKVNRPGFDRFWLATHLGMCCNRGKQSIGLDIKSPGGRDVLDRLVARADVVHHNMRYDAVRRLGLDYEALRRTRPDLIYCHTRGHERGARESLPGNDQTAAALTGITWLEGATDDGGMPLWPPVSLGDTGNGFLSAIAVIQALYHRDRTGEGQFVTTSITSAHLLNASMTWVSEETARTSDRPRLDAQHLGWNQRYRLYETADGWLCIAAVTDGHWAEVVRLVGHDVESGFRSRSASRWFDALDAAGVPCEVADPDYVLSLFDDPDLRARGWTTSYEHPIVGRLDAQGVLVDLDGTPGRVAGPPPVVGQHTDAILAWLGYTDDEITELLEAGAAQLA